MKRLFTGSLIILSALALFVFATAAFTSARLTQDIPKKAKSNPRKLSSIRTASTTSGAKSPSITKPIRRKTTIRTGRR
jgi:hypothetical protein